VQTEKKKKRRKHYVGSVTLPTSIKDKETHLLKVLRLPFTEEGKKN